MDSLPTAQKRPSEGAARLPDGNVMMNSEQDFQESDSGQMDAEDAARMSHLKGLIKERGLMRTAKDLGVNNKTISRNVKENRITPRLREALTLDMLREAGTDEKKSAHDLGEVLKRLDTLESRMESRSRQEEQDDGGANGCMCVEVLDELSRRVSELERLMGAEAAPSGSDLANARGGQAPSFTSVNVVSLEPGPDEEAIFGEDIALVQEWRALKDDHPDRGKGLDWAVDEVRVLEVEIELLDRCGLTLPPETEPLSGRMRRDQLSWRREALMSALKERRKQKALGMLRRVSSLGFIR